MIDTAHGLGLTVMLDVVYNHFGPDGAYLHGFAKPFFRDDIHTPWGAVHRLPPRPEVRDYFDPECVLYLADGVPVRRAALRCRARHLAKRTSSSSWPPPSGRRVRRRRTGTSALVLEHENNRAPCCWVAPRQFDAQWADDLHHCLHVLLTGDEDEGYYEDFQDATDPAGPGAGGRVRLSGPGVAASRAAARANPPTHLPPTAFVVCLQNHDQIGNRAMGERLTTLAPRAALDAATAFLLLSPFIPMVFMGEEYASTTPFLFFTGHHDELAELVREGRRSEFKAFAAFQDEARRAAIPDPNAAGTYDASRPGATHPDHADWMASLLALRRDHVTPGIPGCRSIGAAALGLGAVRAGWAMGDGRTLTIQLNLSAVRVADAAPPGRVLFASPGAAPDALPPASIVVSLG